MSPGIEVKWSNKFLKTRAKPHSLALEHSLFTTVLSASTKHLQLAIGLPASHLTADTIVVKNEGQLAGVWKEVSQIVLALQDEDDAARQGTSAPKSMSEETVTLATAKGATFWNSPQSHPIRKLAPESRNSEMEVEKTIGRKLS